MGHLTERRMTQGDGDISVNGQNVEKARYRDDNVEVKTFKNHTER